MATYGDGTYGQTIYGTVAPEPPGCCCRPIVNLTIIIKKLVLRVKPDEIER